MPRRTRKTWDTCRECERPLPDKFAEPDLCAGTGLCLRCATQRLNQAMKTPAARRWIESWKEKLRTVMQLDSTSSAPR
jgi:hypothetical protein